MITSPSLAGSIVRAFPRGPLVVAVVMLAATAARVDAQQPDTARLEPVVVTATRVGVALPAASLAATVLDGERLRARGITHLADALRAVPGVALVRSGSWGGITSLFVRGGESDYVRVLIDGVPLNAAGGAIDLSTITLDNVERIEIVRGPASVLWGSDAVSGVVQIFTRDGSGAAQGTVGARAGSHAWREARAELAGGDRRASGAIAAATHETDGIHAFNSGYRNDVWDATLRARPGARTDVRMDARVSDAETGIPTDGRGQVVDSNQVRTERRRLAGLAASHIFGTRVEGRLELGIAETDAVSDNQPDSAGDTLGFYSRTESEASRQRVDGRLDLHLHARAVVTVGSEWSRQREVARGSSTFGTSPLPATRFDESRTNLAAYTQLIASGSDRFSATLGARVDDNERFGTFTTGRLAVATRVAGATVRAAVGNAFREPAFTEHFTTAFSVGNPDLEPERTTSWEIGLSRAVAGERVILAATWFDQRFRDMIQYTFQEDRAAPNYFNVARARAWGAELEARLAALGPVEAMASWSIVRTEVTEAGFGDFGAFEEGKPLLRRPRHSGSLVARWRVGNVGALTTTLTHVGRRDDVDFGTFPGTRVVLDPYTLLDLGVEVDLLGAASDRAGALRLTARVENALDHEYAQIQGFASPGRVVYIGARADISR